MPSDLPVHWFGYSPVDVLVWRRPDPAVLSPEQQQALRGWVASGGTLVLLLGDNHASWAASPLADLGGAQPRSLTPSPSALGILWSLAGSGLPPGASKDPNVEDAPPASGEPSLPIVELLPSAGASVRGIKRRGPISRRRR